MPTQRGTQRRHRPTHRIERSVGGLRRGLPRGLRAAAGAAGWLVLVAAVLVLAVLGIGPRTGRYRTLTVLSGSMAPGIPVGSLVIDTPERPDQIRVGQVLTYQIPVGDHRVETHRVIRVLHGGANPVFQTKGDANRTPDPWVAQVTSPTLWRVRAVVPDAGSAIIALRRPAVRAVLVWALPALLALLAVAAIWREPARPRAPAGRHALRRA
ncbi:MAG TPA: signal peptidase I [Actinomycetota bacterium]|nr:signal peptidase I [Actinomycetota bacterium]